MSLCFHREGFIPVSGRFYHSERNQFSLDVYVCMVVVHTTIHMLDVFFGIFVSIVILHLGWFFKECRILPSNIWVLIGFFFLGGVEVTSSFPSFWPSCILQKMCNYYSFLCSREREYVVRAPNGEVISGILQVASLVLRPSVRPLLERFNILA